MKYTKLIVPLLILIFLSGLYFLCNFSAEFASAASMILGLLFTIFLIYLIVLVFGRIDLKKGMLNFIIGDEGGYSLSRLQAVVWAIVIIAYQLSVILCILKNPVLGSFRFYQISFSESALWLIALSLGGCVAVKGITVNAIAKTPSLYKSKRPKLSDILMGSNGLDFSRCQMLIWTLIGIFIFASKVYYFDHALLKVAESKTAGVAFDNLFKNMYNEYKPSDSPIPFLPYLPWSFVVLMGLSQGAYVGKKLVPTFKLDEVKAVKEDELQTTIAGLIVKRDLLNSIIANTQSVPLSNTDKINIAALRAEVIAIQEKAKGLQKDINEISNAKQ